MPLLQEKLEIAFSFVKRIFGVLVRRVSNNLNLSPIRLSVRHLVDCVLDGISFQVGLTGVVAVGRGDFAEGDEDAGRVLVTNHGGRCDFFGHLPYC